MNSISTRGSIVHVTPVDRNIALDGLRGFGALIVVLWHTAVVFFPTAAFGVKLPETMPWQLYFYNSPFWILLSGSFAVSLFFVISGYVLTFKYFCTPDLQGMGRRILGRWPRLAIPAGVSTLCIFFVAQLLPGYCDSQFLPALRVTGSYALLPAGLCIASKVTFSGLLDNLFWRPWFPTPDFTLLYSDVLWTMYIELTGSFMAMCLAIITSLMASRRVAITSILLVVLVVCFAFPPGYGIYFSFFLIGTAVATFDSRVPVNGLNRLGGLMGIGIGFILGGYNGSGLSSILTRFKLESDYIPGGVLIMGLGAVLVFLTVLKSNKIGRMFSSRPILFLGHISYALYLMHFLVISTVGITLFTALQDRLSVESRCFASATVSVFVSIAVAALMTKLVDRPSMIFSHKLSARIIPLRMDEGLSSIR